jgi:DNA-binding transcriptional LysR family regulator
MLDLDALATFVAVVRAGNFSAAAKGMRLPRSTVSQRVARLEAMLGTRLLERTTRMVRTTQAGVAYYERCARILSELEEANAALRDARRAPRGKLRVATPLLFGQAHLGRIAATFINRYPEVELEIVASDRRVNLINEGFDVAIVTASHDDDSALISRKLGGGDVSCCASRAYLATYGTPRSPDDLPKHQCVINREFITSDADTWTFVRNQEKRQVQVRGRLIMNSLNMVHAAIRAGAGIGVIPTFLCADDIAQGHLKRLFADWTIDPKDLRIVYPSSRHLSPRVRLFVDALAKEFADARTASRSKPRRPKALRRGLPSQD